MFSTCLYPQVLRVHRPRPPAMSSAFRRCAAEWAANQANKVDVVATLPLEVQPHRRTIFDGAFCAAAQVTDLRIRPESAARIAAWEKIVFGPCRPIRVPSSLKCGWCAAITRRAPQWRGQGMWARFGAPRRSDSGTGSTGQPSTTTTCSLPLEGIARFARGEVASATREYE